VRCYTAAMDAEYWKKRWAEGQTSFHKEEPHPALLTHEPRLTGGTPSRVLVPLCGKSVDLRWLAARGHSVVGVDLARVALEAFFHESGVTPTPVDLGGHPALTAGTITLVEADLFELDPGALGPFDAVWDRAAIIALPPDLSRPYAQQVRAMMKPGARALVVALEYEPTAMNGPPFAITREAVQSAWAPARVTLLEDTDALAESPRFRERGLTWMREPVLLVEP
jgi:thiopurine S-methyltransferase